MRTLTKDQEFLPPELLIAIEESRTILELKENWDGNGGKPILESTLQRAVGFLQLNASNIWQKFGIQIAVPDIAPVPDGSVDLHWELEDYELLINIPDDYQKPATYGGDDLAGGNGVEGALDTSKAHDWLLPYISQRSAQNTEKKQMAEILFDIGAIKFGAFKLKLHEKNPQAPLSPIYLNFRTPDNPKPGPLKDEIISMIGIFLRNLSELLDLKYHHVAGIPRAGDPIAESFFKIASAKYPFLTILKLVKEESESGRQIVGIAEGKYCQGQIVLLIDDLITQADSKLEAIKTVEENELVVEDILVLVDREQGGIQQLKDLGYNVRAVFTLSELLGYYLLIGKIDRSMFEKVIYYLKQ